MASSKNEKSGTASDDLTSISGWIWRRKLFILSAGALGFIAGVGLSFLSPPIYRSEAILSVNIEEESGALGGLGGDLGSIAAIAGLNIGTDGSSKEEALAFLKSRELGLVFLRSAEIRKSVLEARHLQPWIDSLYEQNDERPEMKAYKLFDQDVRSVDVERKSGLIKVGIRWVDPKVAAEWAARFVTIADSQFRQSHMERYRARVRYLEKQSDAVANVELRNAISRLLESQLRLIMAAESREEFAFRLVDAPVAPLLVDKLSPSRGLYGILGLMVAVTLASFALLARESAVPIAKD